MLLFLFITLEASLQIGSLFFTRSLFKIDKNKKTIIVLGESTSSDLFSSNYISWPKILKEKLSQNGIEVNVVNLSNPGTTSSFLLESLTNFYTKNHADLVVTMMGINDYNHLDLKKTSSFRLKSLSFFSHLLLSLNRRYIPTDLNPTINKFHKLISEDKFSFDLYLSEISKLPRNHQLHVYESLIQKSFIIETSKKNNFKFTRILVNKTLNYSNHNPEIYDYALFFYSEDRDIISCRKATQYFSTNHITPNNIQFHRFSICSSFDSDQLYWHQFFKKYDFILSIDINDNFTRKNYIKLLSLTKKHDSCLITMQYPMNKISISHQYSFKHETHSSDLLNYVNFSSTVRSKGEDKVFVDKFATIFGHTTILGHELIANNLVKFLLQKPTSIECSFFSNSIN